METGNGELESKMEEYEAIEHIGRGALGGAFLVLRKSENKKYVLKKIYLSKHSEKFQRIAIQEMNLIAKLQHPYILEYKDAWVDKGSCICIVTKYCESGNVTGAIKKSRRAYFSEEKICKWLTQLLLAIDYLHSNRVLHRDIKLSNVFVTKENDILLGDFGLAKLLNEEGLASSAAGTPNYMCPELLADSQYGYKSDIWSLGCCMFEIAAHQQAFRAPDMAGLINKINRSLISPLPIVYSSNLKQIIKSMLRKSPEHRPTAAELLRHPHLQPYLLRCHSPSAAFLPVKSPSPSSAKEKTKKPSPSSSISGKDSTGKEATVKQKDLLPLFEESIDMHHPNLLDDDFLTEYQLVTKRVDPTSFSGKISHDSEDSNCGNASETAACNGNDQNHSESLSQEESAGPLDVPISEIAACNVDDQDTGAPALPSKDQNENPPNSTTKLDDTVRVIQKTTDSESSFSLYVSIDTAAEIDAVCRDKVEPRIDENVPLPDNEESTFDKEPKIPSSIEKRLEKDTLNIKESSSEPTLTEKEDSKQHHLAMTVNSLQKICSPMNGNDETRTSHGEEHPPGPRADALETLLELCARLLKQDKFDELSGILKPFSDDAVSSRDTAIWLTKTLMNAQKFPKES